MTIHSDMPYQLPSSVKIGWIGTGVMGEPLCTHLLRAGYSLTIHSRTKSKAERLLIQGAQWAESVCEVAESTDVIFTMVGFPSDVRRVYFSQDGLIPKARAGQLFVDLTTSEPNLAREIAEGAIEHGAKALDAPVSGGEIGAKQGTLSIMVGGDPLVVDAINPIFRHFGSLVVHHGSPGSGQNAKLCNQITIAGTMVGVCEALLYARQAGLDGEKLLESIRQGAAGCWTLDTLAPKMLERNFEPGFYVEHFVKDMGIALSEANHMGLLLPGLAVVHKLYQGVQSYGHGRSGTHALLLALEDMSPNYLSEN